jgi:hypothetical protein
MLTGNTTGDILASIGSNKATPNQQCPPTDDRGRENTQLGTVNLTDDSKNISCQTAGCGRTFATLHDYKYAKVFHFDYQLGLTCQKPSPSISQKASEVPIMSPQLRNSHTSKTPHQREA